MTETTPFAVPDALIRCLNTARAVTVLTGAGISAESGIPTFRDSQTGLWAMYDPHELATPQAFEANPQRVIDWYRWRRELVSRSYPNAGHYALAAMEGKVNGFTLITQNVDGLHVQAGSKNVIELHGSLRRLRCSGNKAGNDGCGYYTDDWPVEGLPECPRCGSLLRPDVVWFGETLPRNALDAALDASRRCDVFLSIGTSGVVEPAASLPYEALRGGAAMVEINPQPTPLSIYSEHVFALSAGDALPNIVARLE